MTFESNHDFWVRMLEELGGQFVPPEPSEPSAPSLYPLMLYKGDETLLVLDESEAQSAAALGWELHPSMRETENAEQHSEAGQDDGPRTMAAAAHNPKFAKKMGIPQKVAKEFNQADTGDAKPRTSKKGT